MSGENAVENGSETPKEETMSSDNVVKIKARPVNEGEIEPQHSLSAYNRPVMASELEVVETISEAGIRPIVASDLHLAGSFLNGRPIAASNLKVEEMLPGNRPIFASTFKEASGIVLSGARPIMASAPGLMEASTLPGGRPIFSNDTVDPDPSALMGYLD